MRKFHLILFLSCILLLSGCLDKQSEKETDYEQTKKMVIDIMQTEEGKKALAEILQDDQMKAFVVFEADEIKEVVTEGLASKEGTAIWEQLFDDPKFVKKFMDSMKDEQKTLYKELMTDASFQKQLLELLQNQEMTELLVQVMRGQQFREHLEETIIETLQSPLFEAKLMDFMQKEKEKQTEKKKEE